MRKAHVPLAGGHVYHGVRIVVAGEHLRRTAGRGCHVAACSEFSLDWRVCFPFNFPFSVLESCMTSFAIFHVVDSVCIFVLFRLNQIHVVFFAQTGYRSFCFVIVKDLKQKHYRKQREKDYAYPHDYIFSERRG